tara:strand:- start:21478 stop:21672 length:195 start_codon:yes stop_codon:yes gene_type:complete
MEEQIWSLMAVSEKKGRGRGHKPLVVGFAKDGLLMDRKEERHGREAGALWSGRKRCHVTGQKHT